MRRRGGMVGVLLAGGQGRRLGGDKASVELRGRTLADRALEPLRAVCETVVVSCRLGTKLPPLEGVEEAWVQREGGLEGPVAGLASALREAGGQPILALAISLPLMTEAVLRDLAGAASDGRMAVVPSLGGRLEPLAGRWSPAALPLLENLRGQADLERVTRLLDPVQIPYDPRDTAFLHVDGPEDVLRAHAALEARATTLRACSGAPASSSSRSRSRRR